MAAMGIGAVIIGVCGFAIYRRKKALEPHTLRRERDGQGRPPAQSALLTGGKPA